MFRSPKIMDFSQNHKINSRVSPHGHNNCPFRDQQSSNYPNSNFNQFNCNQAHHYSHPPLPHQQMNSTAYHQQINNARGNGNFTQQCQYEPSFFNTMKVPPMMTKNSSAQQQPFNHFSNNRFQEQMSTAIIPSKTVVDDFGNEYFKCAPNVQNEKIANQFEPIIELMQHYSPKPVECQQCKIKAESVGEAVNHKTCFYSHGVQSELNDHKGNTDSQEINRGFNSFTKIVSIPNGFEIITRIMKDENCCDDKNCDFKKQNWTGKQIQITLNDNDNSQNDDKVDEKEDEDEDNNDEDKNV